MHFKFVDFIKTDVWRIRLEHLPPAKSFSIRILRIIILTIRGFNSDKCALRASALTFYSLLSIVPVIAMAFGVSKGFGSEKLFEKQLLEKFPGQEEVIVQLISFARSLLDETKSGMLAGIGIAFLFWIVIKLLGNIERSFNDIWGIKKPRRFLQKWTDYLSIMIICPVLLIISGSATVFITTQITLIAERFELVGFFRPVIFLCIKLLPYCVISSVFAFMYLFMPNIKVNFRAGIAAGIIAGAGYQLAQWGYIKFQVGVAQYNAIYGSFAALPLFLVWLQLSWLIVLFGAEISYTIQYVDTYEFEADCSRASNNFKKLLSLQISHLLIKNFSAANEPLTAAYISNKLGTPIRLVNEVITGLVESRIVSEIVVDEKKIKFAYQPACDINKLTIKYIIDAFDQRGVENIPLEKTEELSILTKTLETFSKNIDDSPANKLLKDI